MSFDVDEWAVKHRAAALKNAEDGIRKARETARVWLLLKRSGHPVPAELDGYKAQYGFQVKIDREALPGLREQFGQLEICGKDIADADNGVLNIHVKPKDESWPYGIQFIYQKTLSVEQRCKIITVTPPSYKTLVCDRVA